MTKVAHPKQHGIVSNKEGTGAYEMTHKVGKTHFIVVLTPEGKDQVDRLRLLNDRDAMLAELSENVPLDFLAAKDEIYADKLGSAASRQQLVSAFGTDDRNDVVKQILIHGKFH
jgi:ribosome maturation protein Sdo1